MSGDAKNAVSETKKALQNYLNKWATATKDMPNLGINEITVYKKPNIKGGFMRYGIKTGESDIYLINANKIDFNRLSDEMIIEFAANINISVNTFINEFKAKLQNLVNTNERLENDDKFKGRVIL